MEPTKVKITVEDGEQKQTFEVADYFLVLVKDNQMGMSGRNPGSVVLFDAAYWNWKIGAVVRNMLPQRNDGKTPGGIVVPH